MPNATEIHRFRRTAKDPAAVVFREEAEALPAKSDCQD